MTFEELEILSKTVWGEARGESQQGRRAVAHVILNRRKFSQDFRMKYGRSWWWGSTIKTICLKPWQFSCWNENDPNRKHLEELSLEDDETFREITELMVNVEDTVDHTHGATHYHASWMGKPFSWGDVIRYDTTIGRHLFYERDLP